MTQVLIVSAGTEHYDGWLPLWNLYCGGAVTEVVTQTTWQRILDPGSGIGGIVALCDGSIAGFLFFIEHAASWEVKPVCYVEDLSVAKRYRDDERDVGYKLLSHLEVGLRDGTWARIYGITRAHNRLAQRLYARFTVGEAYERYVMRAADSV